MCTESRQIRSHVTDCTPADINTTWLGWHVSAWSAVDKDALLTPIKSYRCLWQRSHHWHERLQCSPLGDCWWREAHRVSIVERLCREWCEDRCRTGKGFWMPHTDNTEWQLSSDKYVLEWLFCIISGIGTALMSYDTFSHVSCNSMSPVITVRIAGSLPTL